MSLQVSKSVFRSSSTGVVPSRRGRLRIPETTFSLFRLLLLLNHTRNPKQRGSECKSIGVSSFRGHTVGSIQASVASIRRWFVIRRGFGWMLCFLCCANLIPRTETFRTVFLQVRHLYLGFIVSASANFSQCPQPNLKPQAVHPKHKDSKPYSKTPKRLNTKPEAQNLKPWRNHTKRVKHKP